MNPIFCMIIPLGGGPIDPGFGGGIPGVPGVPGYPAHPIHIPGFGPAHPIYIPGVPPGQPGSPTHPIYIPGYPEHPMVPPGSAKPPGAPTHPIHIPGVPDQGLPPGVPIPPETVTPPELPAGTEDDLIVAVRSPGGEWKYTAYDVAPDQGQPAPTPHR
jgi:hypothetical protein